MEGDTIYSQCQSFDEGVLTVIRNILRKNNFFNFYYLLDALQNLDKVSVCVFTFFPADWRISLNISAFNILLNYRK